MKTTIKLIIIATVSVTTFGCSSAVSSNSKANDFIPELRQHVGVDLKEDSHSYEIGAISYQAPAASENEKRQVAKK